MFCAAVIVGLALSAQLVSHYTQPTPSQLVTHSFDTVRDAIVPEDKPWMRAEFIAEPNIKDFSDLYSSLEKINGGTAHCVYKATLAQDRETADKGQEIALVVGSVSKDFKYQDFPRELKAYAHLSRLRAEKISHFIPEIHGVYQSETFFPDDFYISKHEERRFKNRVARVMEVDYLPLSYEEVYTGFSKKPMSPRVAFEDIIGKWAISEFLNCSIQDYDGNVIRHYMLACDPNYLAYYIGDKVYFFEPGLSPRQVDYDTFSIYKEERSREPYRYTDGIEDFVKDKTILKFLAEVKKVGLFQSIKETLGEFEIAADDPRLSKDNVTHLRIPEEYIG